MSFEFAPPSREKLCEILNHRDGAERSRLMDSVVDYWKQPPASDAKSSTGEPREYLEMNTNDLYNGDTSKTISRNDGSGNRENLVTETYGNDASGNTQLKSTTCDVPSS